MYTLKITSAFKKDLKTLLKQGKDLNKLNSVVNKLAAGEELPEKYRASYRGTTTTFTNVT